MELLNLLPRANIFNNCHFPNSQIKVHLHPLDSSLRCCFSILSFSLILRTMSWKTCAGFDISKNYKEDRFNRLEVTHPLDIFVQLRRRLDEGNVRSWVDGRGRLPPRFCLLRQPRLRPQRPIETVAERSGQLLAGLRAHLPLPFVAEVDFGTDDGHRGTFVGAILDILRKNSTCTWIQVCKFVHR